MDGMPKEDKKIQILEAALDAFARYGYKKTTLDDVASALDMTKGNLYLYFQNKKDLYEKTVAFALRRWQGKVAEAAARVDDPSERFMVLGRKAFEYIEADGRLRAVLERDPTIFPLSPADDRFAEINRDSIEMLAGVIRRGVEAGRFGPLNVDHAAGFLFSIYIMFIIKSYVRPEGSSTGRMFEEGLALILRGLENTGTKTQEAQK